MDKNGVIWYTQIAGLTPHKAVLRSNAMIIKEYIKDFERLGFGLFVHFGVYSVIGRGEWAKGIFAIPEDEYLKYASEFIPDEDWATQLVSEAKKAGAKYITLTARHHDGFSLYDTCGLNEYDSVHFCKRDLVREFVTACNDGGIVPFFYHTLLDWHEASYENDFDSYLVYLRKSVELLCKNYGRIGGIWFDGMWHKPTLDWQEDELYGMIRRYQPTAMIINNTGLSARGALGHIELDSVTFERGRPQNINTPDAPKYIASEMCQVMASHWGYAERDLSYISPADIITDLTVCRKCKSNFLLNVGPMGNGKLRPIDSAILDIVGQWTKIYGEILPYAPYSASIKSNNDDDFMLEGDDCYYLLCNGLPMVADPNVVLASRTDDNTIKFKTDKRIKKIFWLDNDEELSFTQNGEDVELIKTPFGYGTSLVVRVAKILF